MGIICLLIIIWAFSDGNFGDLLILFGILIALGLFLSYPGIGLLIVGLIILFYLLFHTEEPKEDNTVKSTSQTHDKEEVVSKPTEEIQNPKQIDIIEGKTDGSGEITTIDDHSSFIRYVNLVKDDHKNDLEYADSLFHLGLLYEKIYKDYFRSAGYIYLATEYDKKNTTYEKEYIRLCKLLEKEKGSDWVYYITLIKDVNDIDVYVNRLLQHVDEKNSNRIRNIKPSKVSTTPKPVIVSRIQSDSKFDDFNTESYLHSLGYKVGKTGLSKAQRRNLLKKAIEGGRITKYDVIETLERNISMFHRRGNMQQAVNDWLDDLSYVRSNF